MGYVPSYIQREPIVFVSNPLSWNSSVDYIDAGFNDGSILRDFNILVRNTAGAMVSNKVLWTNKPRFPGSFFFRTKNYHIADINLYYMNIRKNVEQRILAYIRSKEHPN